MGNCQLWLERNTKGSGSGVLWENTPPPIYFAELSPVKSPPPPPASLRASVSGSLLDVTFFADDALRRHLALQNNFLSLFVCVFVIKEHLI
jgi:hypothetical protein